MRLPLRIERVSVTAPEVGAARPVVRRAGLLDRPEPCTVDAITSTEAEEREKMVERQRRPHNELKNALRDFLVGRERASIAEIKAGCESKVGVAPDSSYRSALQDERYFERVSRGVFKLRP